MAIRSLCITEDADRASIETFIGMHNAGLEVMVVCPADHPNNKMLEDAGVPTIDIRLPTNFNRDGIAALREELIRGRYHIMHTYNNKAVSNGLRACKGLPVKVVCYRGIVGAVSFVDPMSWMRYLNPRIDRIICVAEAVRRYFLQMRPSFLRMPDDRPVTIYKGHKLEWYPDAKADLANLGIPDDAFVVGCAANYRPRKGIEYLVEAMAALPDDVHLVLVGRMDAAELTKCIENSPARDRIHRTGFVPKAHEITAACDAFCMPSTKREGLARAIIEAMVYRVPPVVTTAGGSPELVAHGECGFVVPPRDVRAIADAIAQLHGDDSLRKRLGEAARQRIATKFRHEDTVTKTIALYRELVPDAS